MSQQAHQRWAGRGSREPRVSGMCCGQGLAPTTLSYSSRVSLSPAVLLKLLVLEEEREMFERPFSFSLRKGLERGGTKEGRVAVTRAARPLGCDGD